MANGYRSSGTVSQLITNQNVTIAGFSSRIKSLEGRISRLEDARDSVDAIYQDTSTMVDSVDTYDVGVTWQGNLRENWEDLKSDAVEMGKTYRDDINELYLALDDKITTLSDELTGQQTGLQDANNVLDALERELIVAQWRENRPDLREALNSCRRR